MISKNCPKVSTSYIEVMATGTGLEHPGVKLILVEKNDIILERKITVEQAKELAHVMLRAVADYEGTN